MDSSGRFTGTGWVGGGSQGIPPYDIHITNGKMSGTSITFDVEASYNSGKGSISAKGSGTLNAPFPNAMSASGVWSGTISDPLITSKFTLPWTAEKVPDGDRSADTPATAIVPPPTPTLVPQENEERARQHYNQGVILLGEGRLDEAILEFNEAIRLNPNYAKAFYNRGFAYHRKKEYDQAFSDYTEAIRLDPNHAKAYNSRGSIHLDRNEYDQAIADYTMAIQLAPNYASAYSNRALTYGKKGHWDLCIADCNKAIELDSNYVQAYNNRAWAFGMKGHWDLSIADCNRVIELDSSNDIAYCNRGVAYKGQGKKAEAIADFETCITLTDDPQRVEMASGQIEELSN